MTKTETHQILGGKRSIALVILKFFQDPSSKSKPFLWDAETSSA
ncbi:MAG: hypothetical protein V5804_12900 [Mucilaginibacter sp.]